MGNITYIIMIIGFVFIIILSGIYIFSEKPSDLSVENGAKENVVPIININYDALAGGNMATFIYEKEMKTANVDQVKYDGAKEKEIETGNMCLKILTKKELIRPVAITQCG